MKQFFLLLVCIPVCSMSLCQNVGINMSNPGFPLNFPGTLGDKISLWGNSGNHYGLGIQANLLQVHTDMAASDIAFGHGTSAIFNELMRIKGNGNVGIGVSDPSFLLDIGGRLRLRNGSGGTAGIYFNKNDNSAMSSFLGTYDDNHLGIYGENGVGWNFFMNTANGNVGIGTVPNNNAKLHVNTGSGFGRGFLVSGNLETLNGFVPDYGAGSRLMFYPGKSAFRAGTVQGTQWDNASVGLYSCAIGNNTTASGLSSVALGNNTIASGMNSTSMGSGTIASGRNSTAMGISTAVNSYGGVTIGIYNDNNGTGDPNNIVPDNRIFQIGNGTATNARKNAMTVLQNGNTGIGITFPEQLLDVGDRIRLRSGPQGTAGLWLSNTDNSDLTGFIGTYANNYIGMYGQGGAGWGLFMNTVNGNVGIGTSNPTYKLAVNGSIRSKEIRVESGWADFVFENNFKLLPLDEVELFITKHKRLPDLPSAKEIQDNGLPLGELQTKMMQKIEELTLYLIEANKRIEKLEKESRIK